MRRNHPEDGLQEACAQYCDNMGWAWFHCPNEGKRGKAEAARLQRQGVKPGIPDVMICEYWDTGRMIFDAFGSGDVLGFGVAVELKIKPNKPTPSQLDWLRRLRDRGWKTAVAYSTDEFIEIVQCIQGRGKP